MFAKASTSATRSILAVFVSILLVASLVPVYALAEPADDADTLLSTQATIPASGNWETCSWAIDAQGALTVKPRSGVSGVIPSTAKIVYGDRHEQAAPWLAYASQITSATFAPGLIASERTSMMFRDCSSLKSVDISKLDTSRVTDMYSMFGGCSSLEHVDLSRLNTAKVADMRDMFFNCSSLISVDLSSFDTTRVTDMQEMFDGCSSLESLDLSNLETAKVTNMYRMFKGCSSLTSLDLSPLDISSVTNMACIFEDCTSLASVNLSGIDTSSMTAIGGMFKNCASLSIPDLSKLDTSNVESMGQLFQGCTQIQSTAELNLDKINTASLKRIDKMFYGCTGLKSASLAGFDTSSVTSMYALFGGCTTLESVDLSGVDTQLVEDMGSMFAHCSSLKQLDLSSFNTEVTVYRGSISMFYIFYGCYSLDRVTFENGFVFEDDRYSHLPDGIWRASSTGNVFTSSELAALRGNIADTYTRVKTPIDTITLSQTSYAYSGEASVPQVTVTTGGVTLAEGADYTVAWPTDVVNAGEKTITITGRGNYEGTLQGKYIITPLPIDSVNLDQNSFAYDGTARRPLLAVRSGDTVLNEGADYDVSWPSDCASAGLKNIIVNGKGNYSGTKNATFEITPLSIDSVSLSQEQIIYDGAVKHPSVAVNAGAIVLIENDDYDISWPADCVSAGQKMITVSGKGNYSGTKSATFEIAQAPVTSASPSTAQYIYDGLQKMPSITVKSGDKVLNEGRDYDISWPSDISSVGKKEATVSGKGNYSGSVLVSYEIVPAKEPVPDPTPEPDPQPVPDPDPIPVDPTPENPMPGDFDEADPEPDGPASSNPDDPDPVGTQAMYRLYNSNSGEHFYTASTLERDAVIAAGWNDEGIGWTAPTEGIQVYRLYNSFAGEHHYTTSEAERDMLVSVGWTWEEGGWYSDINQAVPLYRAYNPNAFANNHHYTTDWGEFVTLLGLGWQDEGVGWHGIE